MKYYVDYQYMPKGAARPLDDGEAIAFEADDTRGNVVLPNARDYVQIENSMDPDGRVSFSGKVRSKLFRYIRSVDDVHCGINIVVEETDDDWGRLIKE